MNTDADTWMGDLDLSEMFLFFWLDEQIRPMLELMLLPLGSVNLTRTAVKSLSIMDSSNGFRRDEKEHAWD